MSEPGEPSGIRKTLLELVDSPLAGLSPWIAFALITGPERLEEAAIVSLALALFFFGLTRLRGRSLKALELVDVVFFGALAVIVAVASTDTREWLELWSGEIANITLAVFALAGLALRRPFTLAYARDEAPEEVWDTPQFLHVNYVITWAWAIAFIIGAASGFYGDQVLEDTNNLWTGWVIQTAALIVAAQFTAWYPERAEARFAREQGENATAVPVSGLLVPLAGWITAVGVIVLVTGEGPTALGVGLIIAGAAIGNLLGRDAQQADEPTG